MADFQVTNDEFPQIVRANFMRQGLMQHLGATLEDVQPGYVRIQMPYQHSLTQQHGYFHAGAITSIVDSACGYAALTLMPPDTDVLTIEYKVNFMAPARGTLAIAHGRVLKPGRTITVCQGEVITLNDNREQVCATMLATIIGRPIRP
ncbi:thioesterase [Dictyobacter sp. S3.2.2.5]|uniref:Medium/long-chain acyl-CoA thioesterase YigI n=1 Tax=Dictyobacter halimunensis TaxID=3026934 RepID=A0ABQ6FQN6_9CHLR|nr:thioesterase [Dictyobacter sp. S3.2.2.5]